MSQESIELYNKFNSLGAIDETFWGFSYTKRKILEIVPKASDTLSAIDRELSTTLSRKVLGIMNEVGESDGVLSILSQVIMHCGEQDVPKVVSLKNDLDSAPKPHKRGRMVDYQLEAALALAEAGHIDEGYAILETTLAVLTKKKED